MDNNIFLTILFIPFIFSLYLILKRVSLSPVNKNVLDAGLPICSIIALVVSAYQHCTQPAPYTIFLIISNFIFFMISALSYLFFRFKKQFMFTRLRYFIFLSLFMSTTNLFIISNNLVTSLILWILSGLIIYIFSYFDIFKTNSDYNPNRFYSVFLTGDFALLLATFIFVKYALVSDNFSYFINFEDINSITSYIVGNSDFEYIIMPICVIIALFSRAFIFPFSCCFSFLANSSNVFYMVIYSTITPLYSLVLFLKMGLFEGIGYYFKIYLVLAAIICALALLFEKNFKIILGHILSIFNSLFIIFYFYNKYALLAITVIYIGLILASFGLFLKDKSSFKRRIINIKKGFLIERIYIFFLEKMPVIIADIVDFIDKKIIRYIFKLIFYVIDFLSYRYMLFIRKKDIPSILKGILITFALFAILSIFIALFGNFGEMQS